MSDGLRPYPKYEHSGVPWLEDVPESWNVLRGRHLFEIKKRIAGELGHPVFSVTKAGLRVKDVNSGQGQVSQDYSKYQIVAPGEFVMNSMDLLTGGVGLADAFGVTSPDYRVFAIRDGGQCRDRYVLHLLRMLYANRGFYAWGQGSAQLGRWRLPRKRFNEFLFPVPPPDEQSAIVRFLDHYDRLIRRYIAAKRKLIVLLNEQKQAIIHRAVTRGLDPNVRLKPSGVEWLGDVPAHWEVKKLGNLGAFFKGRGISKSDLTDDGLPAITYGDIYTQYDTHVTEFTKRIPEGHAKQAQEILNGDLLFTASGETIDEIGKTVYYSGEGPAFAGGDVIIFRGANSFNGLYLSYSLNSPLGIFQKSMFGRGDIIVHISPSKLKQVFVSLPPIQEQAGIAAVLTHATSSISRSIDLAKKEIALIQEYRTRIVGDVVTGKLDVRESAARLPDETEEPEAFDDADPLAEGEEASSDDLDGALDGAGA